MLRISKTQLNPRAFTSPIVRMAVGTLSLVLLTGCGSSVDEGSDASAAEPKQTLFEAAHEHCTSGEMVDTLSDEPVWKVEERLSRFFQVGDEGKTFIASGVDATMMPFLVCFLGEFETPESIVASMNSTTSMMGRQEQTDGDISYEWTYHPDNGMDLIATDAS